jgi:hypothetical protein
MTRKIISITLITLLAWAACALSAGSSGIARQTVMLEVVEVVEMSLNSLPEIRPTADEDQPATQEVGFEYAPLVVSPDGFHGKVTVTTEPRAVVEVSVEASAGGSEYPRAAVRLTLTDP